MYASHLKPLGLSDKEATIYLASLELGPATIQDIAQKCQLSRSTAYEVIESLMKRGLMSSMTKGKKKYFSAEKPEKLMDIISDKEKELNEKKRELKALLPDLQELARCSTGIPKVRFYEGKKGIRQIQEDILKTKNLKSIEEIIPLDDTQKLFPDHPRDHRRFMARRINVSERVIYTSKRGAIFPQKSGAIERRFIPFEKFPSHTEITVYGDKVAFVTFGRNVTGVVLEGEEIAETLRFMFDMFWKKSKRYEK